MKILIVSDTHGVVHPRILQTAAGCELIIHCGDIGHGGVLQQLQEHAVVHAVRGNNDIEWAWPTAQHARLQGIPWRAEIELPGGSLGFCHGHQEPSVEKRHAYLRQQFSGCRAVAYGHSHQLLVDTSVPECQVINPGAAGRTRTHGGPSCLILQASESAWSLQTLRFEL